MKIPILDLKSQYENLKDEIEAAVLEALRSCAHILGPKVKEFEEKAAEFLAVKHAIGCANGTDALQLALMALDIKSGDEVITTPFTYAATTEAISIVGAKPVFADINPDTYNIDPKSIESKITEKTKAIMIVHLYGQCCDMHAILSIAKKHNLKIIEDSAQAFGSKYTCPVTGKEFMAGGIGDIGTFSFYPTKNLGCAGDGGLITTNDSELDAKLRRLRVHGSSKRYHHEEIGMNSRLDEIQAAILLVKLQYINSWNQHRAKLADIYNQAFANIDGITTPRVLDACNHIYHQYTIKIDPKKTGFTRDELRERLKEQGIASEIYYPIAMHMQNVYKDMGHQAEDFPHSYEASENILCLPIYAELSEESAKEVAESICPVVTA